MLKTNLALETRRCKCGCKKTWRCLPSSTSEYYSILHKCRTLRELTQDWVFGQTKLAAEQQTLRARIKEAFEEGLSVKAITARINEMGFRNSKRKFFKAQQIYNIVHQLGLRRRPV